MIIILIEIWVGKKMKKIYIIEDVMTIPSQSIRVELVDEEQVWEDIFKKFGVRDKEELEEIYYECLNEDYLCITSMEKYISVPYTRDRLDELEGIVEDIKIDEQEFKEK